MVVVISYIITQLLRKYKSIEDVRKEERYMELTSEQLQELVTCKKKMTVFPKKIFEERNGCRRNDCRLFSEESQQKFTVFMRQNMMLAENFSVGLIWHAVEADAPITIYRCNGRHGGNKNIEHHNACHIHMLNLEKAANNIYKDDDVHITSKYSTFDEAVYFFCEHCGIVEANRYFPTAYAIRLFEE